MKNQNYQEKHENNFVKEQIITIIQKFDRYKQLQEIKRNYYIYKNPGKESFINYKGKNFLKTLSLVKKGAEQSKNSMDLINLNLKRKRMLKLENQQQMKKNKNKANQSKKITQTKIQQKIINEFIIDQAKNQIDQKLKLEKLNLKQQYDQFIKQDEDYYKKQIDFLLMQKLNIQNFKKQEININNARKKRNLQFLINRNSQDCEVSKIWKKYIDIDNNDKHNNNLIKISQNQPKFKELKLQKQDLNKNEKIFFESQDLIADDQYFLSKNYKKQFQNSQQNKKNLTCLPLDFKLQSLNKEIEDFNTQNLKISDIIKINASKQFKSIKNSFNQIQQKIVNL